MPATATSQARIAPRRYGGEDTISTALEQVLARYTRLVKQAARQRDLSEADIDEVLQDVRIRLWRALSTGKKIAEAPASYVYRTAVSAALDLIRRRKARREEELDRSTHRLSSGPTERPDREVEGVEVVEELDRAITRLGDSRRLVVLLHLAGYHRHEIADLLGWTEAKTRNLLYRGLSDLRHCLQETVPK